MDQRISLFRSDDAVAPIICGPVSGGILRMKRTTWTLVIAGLLTGGLGLQLLVTQPLNRQINTLTAEMDDLQSGMRQVADFRDDVAGTNDLLSGLEAQSRRIDQVRAALGNIQRLEREIRLQSASAHDALASLTDIARMQSEVIGQSERIASMQETLDELAAHQGRVERLSDFADAQVSKLEQAEESLRQLGDFQQRVAIASSGLDVAENRFERLVGLKTSLTDVSPVGIEVAKSRIAELDELKTHVLSAAETVEVARETSDELIRLQEDIITRGNRTEVARLHAEQLLDLEERLANDASLNINLAVENLAALLEIEEQLASQDTQLAAAIESLEIMQDFQAEFFERSQDLERIRRGLTELILMESLVARTVRSLQPLTELTNLRRLDSDRLRSIARAMVEEPHHRVATNDPQVHTTPSSMESEPIEPGNMAEVLVPVPPVD